MATTMLVAHGETGSARRVPAVADSELRRNFHPIKDGDLLACPRCGAEHDVFSTDGEPRLQIVRCGSHQVPVGVENRRIPIE
jgi:hypothetical protein